MTGRVTGLMSVCVKVCLHVTSFSPFNAPFNGPFFLDVTVTYGDVYTEIFLPVKRANWVETHFLARFIWSCNGYQVKSAATVNVNITNTGRFNKTG